MENATKALLMAASVLIGILIISLGINLYIIIGEYVKESNKEREINEINKFNEQFLKYDGREDLTIQDVITASNIALENNKSHSNYDTSITATKEKYYVDVYFTGNTGRDKIFNIDKSDLLRTYIEDKIKCKVSVSTVTGRVFSLEFKKMEKVET